MGGKLRCELSSGDSLSLHQAFSAACGSFSLYPPLLQDSARSTWIKSTANILRSCFKTVSLSSQQKRLGKKEFSTLRRLTLSIFSVMVAAMRSKLASLCGGQTKARRTARCRSLVKVESSLCLARRKRLLWRRRRWQDRQAGKSSESLHRLAD